MRRITLTAGMNEECNAPDADMYIEHCMLPLRRLLGGRAGETFDGMRELVVAAIESTRGAPGKIRATRRRHLAWLMGLVRDECYAHALAAGMTPRAGRASAGCACSGRCYCEPRVVTLLGGCACRQEGVGCTCDVSF